MYHIISHNDLDGYGSAYLVREKLTSDGIEKKNINIINTDYSKELDLDQFKKGDTIYITDFSLKPENMNELFHKGINNIIWIDHHKSALDYKQDYLYNEKIKGLQEVGMSATALTWIWFYASDKIKRGTIEEQEAWLEENAPKWVVLVDVWDCWKLNNKNREEAEQLNTAVSNILSYDVIRELNGYNLLNSYLNKGKTYIECMKEYSESYLKKYAFGVTIEVNYKKYNGIVINRGACGSKSFNDLINKYDVCISFASDGEKVTTSLYSNKDYFDCSKICKILGGGGHKGAAGFVLDLTDRNLYDYFHKNALWLFKIDDWEGGYYGN